MKVPDVLVECEDTGADTDVFSGTEAAAPKHNGYALYWAASTVNTATIEVPQYGHDVGRTSLLQKRADGIPEINAMVPFRVQVVKGAPIVINLGGTTGTVHHILAIYYNKAS